MDIKKKKPKCILTVDVEAVPERAASDHVNTLIYGRIGGREYGIGRMMDIADKHDVKMTFFVDFAECELYGDAILEAGRYILSRGHDMQVHCHHDYLGNIVGKSPWEAIDENSSWYNDDMDSKKMVDYVTERYIECAGKMPEAYRGGAYRFGVSILKALKNKGYKADFSYNSMRPWILPVNKQFVFENGLLELPISILSNKQPLNFNSYLLEPETPDDFDTVIAACQKLFADYYEEYGEDSIATFLMHSWSFLYSSKKVNATGYFDEPNDLLVSMFDRFLGAMKEKIDFISAAEAIDQIQTEKLKSVDFAAVFNGASTFSRKNLLQINDFIQKKAKGRQVVVWGKGWIESAVFASLDLHKTLNTAYYISKDADRHVSWRGKPVRKYSEAAITPDKDYILVLAQPSYSDIRDTLQGLGYKEFEDYFDIMKKLPAAETNGVKSVLQHKCPICGGELFETYNSSIPRRCSACGSLERTRTMAKLFSENIKIDDSKWKILHVSPTKPERLYFKNRKASTTTVDIRPECRVDIEADICNMPEIPSESFDMVFANCVLNHVYDDEKALGEIERVLRSGGMALLWVQDSGTLKTVEHEDPTGWYGKENYEKYRIGTFRHYGEVDFTRQLRTHFPEVKCFEKYDEVTDSSCKWYQCRKG